MATKGFIFVFAIVFFICLHHGTQATPLDELDDLIQSQPTAESCATDEEFYSCTDEQCTKYCKDLLGPQGCGRSSMCNKPGCLCKTGFLRDEAGKCIPQKECPTGEGGPQPNRKNPRRGY